MARKKKLYGIAINNFKLNNKDYVIGDKYSTTNAVRFNLMKTQNLITNK